MDRSERVRWTLAILSGVTCIVLGIAQVLYALLAIASVIFVDVLGVALTLLSAGFAVVPEEPYEIPYPRELVTMIGIAGGVLAFVIIFAGCRAFYRHRISIIDFSVCVVSLMLMGLLHLLGELPNVAFIYALVGVLFAMFVCADWLAYRYRGQESKLV